MRSVVGFVVVVAIVIVLLTIGSIRARQQMHPKPAGPLEKSAMAAAAALDRLPVVERRTADPNYRRAAFGSSWADLDGDGCRTRDEELLATVDRRRPFTVRRQGRCRADVIAGSWTDLYSGAVMTWTDLHNPTQAEGLPIDHILSLGEAYRYGAKDWTYEQRVRFANDEENLTPTTRAINSAKSDRDPAEWSPPPTGQCFYAIRYITVKTAYSLPVDSDQRTALRRLIAGC